MKKNVNVHTRALGLAINVVHLSNTAYGGIDLKKKMVVVVGEPRNQNTIEKK
jgi:hypothetical protein